MLTISELNTFTCVAVWDIPAGGFICFVTATNAPLVIARWLIFDYVGL